MRRGHTLPSYPLHQLLAPNRQRKGMQRQWRVGLNSTAKSTLTRDATQSIEQRLIPVSVGARPDHRATPEHDDHRRDNDVSASNFTSGLTRGCRGS